MDKDMRLRISFRVVDFAGTGSICSCTVPVDTPNVHDTALGIVVRNYVREQNNGIKDIVLYKVTPITKAAEVAPDD